MESPTSTKPNDHNNGIIHQNSVSHVEFLQKTGAFGECPIVVNNGSLSRNGQRCMAILAVAYIGCVGYLVRVELQKESPSVDACSIIINSILLLFALAALVNALCLDCIQEIRADPLQIRILQGGLLNFPGNQEVILSDQVQAIRVRYFHDEDQSLRIRVQLENGAVHTWDGARFSHKALIAFLHKRFPHQMKVDGYQPPTVGPLV